MLGSPALGWSEEQTRILFVASQHTDAYIEFAALTRRALETGSHLLVDTATALADESTAGPSYSGYDMVIAMGTRAARVVANRPPQTPVIYTLIPEITFEDLRRAQGMSCAAMRCTAVYIDQPLDRQLRVLQAAFGQPRVGVLFGPASRRYEPLFDKVSNTHGLTAEKALIDEPRTLLRALDETLQKVDVLLALPDPVVYNSRTAQSILLTTYRYKIPLMAFSKAYTDAGATLSVYSTPAQMAAQTARIVRDFVRGDGGQLPAPAYPEQFRIQVNGRVARSMGIDFEKRPEFLALVKESDNE